MATVPEFISVAALIILTAISARLAAITLLNNGTSQDTLIGTGQSSSSGTSILVETSSDVDTLKGACRAVKDGAGRMSAVA